MKIYIKNKKFKDKLIFENTELNIKKGLNILLGENGSGKSTLLNMIYKKDVNFEGEIKVNGINIDEIEVSDYRNNYCNYIMQDNHLFKDLKVLENINILCDGYDEKELSVLVGKLFFSKVLSKNNKVKNLSGGEKQKLKIIIGLLSKGKILLIDELDNNLDQDSIENLVEYLKVVDKTIIIASHNEKKFQDIRINIIKIEKNKIISKKTTKNLSLEVNEGVKKINKKGLSSLLKINELFRIGIASLMTIFCVFLFILTNYLFVYLETAEIMDYGKFGENSTIIYAPMHNTKFDSVGDATWLEKTPDYFTTNDKEKIIESGLVKKIIPVGSLNKIYAFDIRDDKIVLDLEVLSRELNYEKYNLEQIKPEQEIQYLHIPSYVLDPNVVTKNLPIGMVRTSLAPIRELYGELPKDESNEILLNLPAAIYFADKLGLNKLEDLIGKEIEIVGKRQLPMKKPTGKKSANPTKMPKQKYSKKFKVKHKISGINLSQDIEELEKFVITYAYNPKGETIQDNNPGLEHDSKYYPGDFWMKREFSPTNGMYELIGAEYMDFAAFKEKFKDEKMNIGFYIETNNEEDTKKLTEMIRSYDPYIEIYNNYTTSQGSNFRILQNILIKAVALFVIGLGLYFMLIKLLFKYYKLRITQTKETLNLFGVNEEDIKVYNKKEDNYFMYTYFSFILILLLIVIVFEYTLSAFIVSAIIIILFTRLIQKITK